MPQRAAADYASLLRQLADRMPADLQHLAPEMLAMADAFERAINNTNNQIAGVIGTIELGLSDQIMALSADVDRLRAFFQEHDQTERAERAELTAQIDELKQATEQILGLLRDSPDAAGDNDVSNEASSRGPE